MNAGEYFETNLDHDVSYMIPEGAKLADEIISRVEARHQKLQNALEQSGLQDEEFAALAAELFSLHQARFEAMSASELAAYTKAVATGDPLPERITWAGADPVADSRFLTNEEWVMLRRFGIGGSDAANIFDVGYESARSVYYNKLAAPVLVPEAPNPIFERGHYMEPEVIKLFSVLRGATLIPEKRMFRSKAHPRCIADVDAVVQTPEGDIFIFEAKTTSVGNFKAWQNGIPAVYTYQVRQYPAVLADDRIKGTYIGCIFTNDLVVAGKYLGSEYNNKDFKSAMIERNPEYEQDILAREEEWWNETVATRTLPDPSGDAEKETRAIQTFETGLPKREKRAINLSKEALMDMVQEYEAADKKRKAAKDKLDAAEEECKALKNDLLMTLGPAEIGLVELDDEYVEIKNTIGEDRVVFDTAAIAALRLGFPEAYAACGVTKPGAVRFSLKRKKKTAGWRDRY